MKQQFLIQKNHPRLLLVFAGWGMDATPFRLYKPADCDFLLCYDYRTLTFDSCLISRYREIQLVAWSMGVWAASQIFREENIPVKQSIAINGTITPIHNRKGIPALIYQKTLENLSESSYRKFLLRMCGGTEEWKSFITYIPQRSIEELKEELRRIEELMNQLPTSSFTWNKAFIGKKDLIFPPDNQLCAWERNTPTEIRNIPHYSANLFKELLQWTK